MNRKTLIYIGGGIGAMTLTFLLLSVVKKRKLQQEQNAFPKDPQDEPDKPTREKIETYTALGKKIYTKVENARIRTTADVNNGIVNNVKYEVPNAGKYLGIVKQVIAPDNKAINPATNKPYVWFYFPFDKALYEEWQASLSFLFRDAWAKQHYGYVREDIVKM